MCFFLSFFLVFLCILLLATSVHRGLFYEITNFQIFSLFPFRMKFVLFHLFPSLFCGLRFTESWRYFIGCVWWTIRSKVFEIGKKIIYPFSPDGGGRWKIASHSIYATSFTYVVLVFCYFLMLLRIRSVTSDNAFFFLGLIEKQT